MAVCAVLFCVSSLDLVDGGTSMLNICTQWYLQLWFYFGITEIKNCCLNCIKWKHHLYMCLHFLTSTRKGMGVNELGVGIVLTLYSLYTISWTYPGKSWISPCWSQPLELLGVGHRGVDVLYLSAAHLWHQIVGSIPCFGGHPGYWSKYWRCRVKHLG